MTIYTIGHSNIASERFVDLLRLHLIQLLVDTRSQPYSRYAPQFNREALQTSIELVGITCDDPGKVGAVVERVAAIWRETLENRYPGQDGDPSPVLGDGALVEVTAAGGPDQRGVPGDLSDSGEQLGQRAVARRDHRRATGRGFDRWQAEALAFRGQQQRQRVQ